MQNPLYERYRDILSSIDPVVLDKACLDLIYKSDDPGKKQLIERKKKSFR